VSELLRRGLPPRLAEYFARHVAEVSASERRARAQMVTIGGAAWLVGGLIVLVVAYVISGAWPLNGPWLVGWGVVLCGGLRLVGGLLTLPYRRANSDDAKAQWRPLSRPGGPTKRAPRPMPEPLMATNTLSALDYRTLGLQPEVPADAVRRAYRDLAQIWHPDRFGDSNEWRGRAEQKMKQINAAYARLCNDLSEHSTRS